MPAHTTLESGVVNRVDHQWCNAYYLDEKKKTYKAVCAIIRGQSGDGKEMAFSGCICLKMVAASTLTLEPSHQELSHQNRYRFLKWRCLTALNGVGGQLMKEGVIFKWIFLSVALPAHVLCAPPSASVGDRGVWHLAAYGYRDGHVVR